MKKIGFVDLIIIAGIIIAMLVGLFTVKNFRQTADKQIEATSQIVFQVFLRGVTVTSSEFPVKINEKTFITIRNVPYTELEVTAVESQPRKILSSAKSQAVDDPAQPALFDAVITVKDTAKITKDGAVVGGNKIKMGLPVTIEGVNYRFNGIISDLKVTSDFDNGNNSENADIG